MHKLSEFLEDASVTKAGTAVFLIVGICAAYPLYARITAMRRKKIAPEIMRLSDELLK